MTSQVVGCTCACGIMISVQHGILIKINVIQNLNQSPALGEVLHHAGLVMYARVMPIAYY